MVKGQEETKAMQEQNDTERDKDPSIKQRS